MKTYLAAVAFAAGVISAPSVWAEGNVADATDMQALRAAVRTDKKALVASTLQLTDAEAKKFWPLYDSYQRTVDMANRERAWSSRTSSRRMGRCPPLCQNLAKGCRRDETESGAAHAVQPSWGAAGKEGGALPAARVQDPCGACLRHRVGDTVDEVTFRGAGCCPVASWAQGTRLRRREEGRGNRPVGHIFLLFPADPINIRPLRPRGIRNALLQPAGCRRRCP
jgi:hypothetical protein